MVELSQVNVQIETQVEKERQSSHQTAHQQLADTTDRGADPRKFKTNLIPLSVLFNKPQTDQVQISPNGTFLAWRSRVRSMGDPHKGDNGVLNLFVKNQATNCTRQITFSKELNACVHFIFTPDEKNIVFLREKERGSEHYHLYSIEIHPFFDQDDSKADDPENPPPTCARNLIKDANMTCGIGFAGGIQLWTSSKSPRNIFLSTSMTGPYALFWSISQIDIDTTKLTVVEQNVMSTTWGRLKVVFRTILARLIKINPPGIPIQWFPDNQMSFRGRLEVNLLNLGASFCARNKKGQWNALHSCSFEETNLQLIGSSGGAGTARMEFDGDNVDIHLCAFNTGDKVSDTTTYDRFSINTGQYLKRVAGGNAESDITGFVADSKGRAQFVCYEYEKKSMEIITDAESDDDHSSLADDIQYIKSYFKPSMTFQIVSRTNSDDTMWVVFAENDIGHSMFKGSPSAYYLFTRTSSEVNRKMELIFPSRPEMKHYSLSRMDPVHIKARDGEDILCYLSSIPTHTDSHASEPPGPPPPLVMVIHGGPQARDGWGYNPLSQFLCSRGFRVLQVNYRGSTGFGARFLRIGMNGEFCKSLQDDIVDAAKYAISNSDTESADDLDGDIPPRPWGDLKQLAILGGSFGGYSALWQMTSNPGLYQCAIAICPISSVGAADAHSKKAFGGSPLIAKYWKKVFGFAVSKSKASAMKASPMYHIGKVRKGSSIGLYHGDKDPRAPIQHSYNVLRELKTCGIAGEFVEFSGEGHGLSKECNSLYMYYRIEDLLCKTFGLSAFDAGDDVQKFEKNTGTVKWSAEYTKGKTD